MKMIVFSAFTILLFAFTAEIKLTGRWESVSPTGAVTGVVFKDDGTFNGDVNKKPFVYGTFRFNEKDSMFSFVDNGCQGMQGTYKIDFFSNSDSMRLIAISDSCLERKAGMQRLVLGRVK